jgi:ribonuclease Z
LTLLGTGGPRPDPQRQGPAALVTVGRRHLLFDAGRGVATQLVRAGVQPQELDAVFITHHHYDHISNLGDVLMSAWNNGRTRPLPVFGPPGTVKIVDALLGVVYAADATFRLREAAVNEETLEPITAMVDVHDIDSGMIYTTDDIRVATAEVDHGDSLGLPADSWKALGYRVSSRAGTVAFSGDAVASPGLRSLADGADILVMCCYLATEEIDSPELEYLASNVLASAPQVGPIAAEAKVKHLVLTHLRQKSSDLLASIRRDVGHDFDGVVTLGADLLAIDL